MDKNFERKATQFYMVWNSKLYFVNTYPFFNGKNKVIGAILFMRGFETMPETKFETTLDGYLMPVRHSDEFKRPVTATQTACSLPPKADENSK